MNKEDFMSKKKVIESTVEPVIEAEVVEKELSPQERIGACNSAIADALRKFNCDLMVSTLLEPPNVVRPIIRIVPKQ
jgi:hypothetical protein